MELALLLETPSDPGSAAPHSTPVVDSMSLTACIGKTLQAAGQGAYRCCCWSRV